MKVCTVQEMLGVHQRAIDAYGLSDALIMENAGLAAFDVLRRELGPPAKRIVLVCGTGDKGGAGLVLARRLHAAGAHADVFVVGDSGRFHGASLDSFEAARRCGVPWRGYNTDALRRALHGCWAFVDAMLDADHDDVGDEEADIIEIIEAASCPVLSLDIPSGVCGDTGQLRAAAVQATMTVSFGMPKRGNVIPPGSSRCGRLYVSHLTYPPELQRADEVPVTLVHPSPLPPRSPHGHKGSFGDTLFVAGAAGYYGAPVFASMASLRAGAGYARLACPRCIAPTLAMLAPEVVFLPQEETDAGSIAHQNLGPLVALSDQVDFVVAGPGLSLHPGTQDLVRDLVRDTKTPLLLDGDGLTAIAKHPHLVRGRKGSTVLTPHPGEMARLLGTSTKDIIVDPIGSALRGAERFGAVVVLKGARTVVAHPDGHATVNTSGNDGMGTAGSGDVLTGIIAAVHGLGVPLRDAVATGVFLHGFAGDCAMATVGADGMTARSILDHVPEAVRAYRQEYEAVVRDHRGAITVV